MVVKNKVVLLGDSGVGKSAILHQFKLGSFSSNTESTIGCEFFAKSININDEEVKLLIWDTAGQEVFRAFTKNFLRGAKIVLIVYDVSRYSTFQSLKGWFDECLSGCPDASIILLGNKDDLEKNVTECDIKEYKKLYKDTHNFQYYGSISAKNNEGVNNFFNFVAKKILENNYNIDIRDDAFVSLDKLSDNSDSKCCGI